MALEAEPGGAPAAELAWRIMQRAPGAEEELVQRYSRGISAVLSRMINGASVVEDLRQDTLRIVIEKVRNGDLREHDKLSGFICNTARNLAVQQLRLGARRRAVSIDDIDQVAETAPSQLDRLLQNEQGRLATEVLREMETEKYRQLLYSFYIAEEPKISICARLGLSSLNFNRVLHRAKERYRALYEEAMARHAKK